MKILFNFSEDSSSMIDKKIKRVEQNRQKNCRVACFSEYCKDDNIYPYERTRMWSQYASDFTGVCLVFDRDKVIKTLESIKSIKCIKFKEIFYTNDNTKLLVKYDDSDRRLSDEKLLNKKINEINMIKNGDFKDESEFRIIVYSEDESEIYCNIEKSLIGIIVGNNFPETLLPSLYFFCKIKNIPCFIYKIDEGKYSLMTCGCHRHSYYAPYLEKLNLKQNRFLLSKIQFEKI